MYIHLKILSRAFSLAVLKRRPTLRFAAWLFVITAVFSTIWILLAIGRVLDHVFFPGFRRQEIREPVFIIAPPRSGTTHLQHLLCLDKERFTHLKLYHTIFPCVLYLKMIDLLARVDRFIGGPLRKLVRACEQRWFGGWNGLHTMRFTRPEEDEGFFAYTFVSEAAYLLFPFAAEIPEAALADRLPAKSRRRLMAFYRSCLKRHLYASGGGEILLSKNTLHSGRIATLLEAFPDARIITIVRDPREAIPSSVKLFCLAWKAHSPDIATNSPESRAYAEINVEYYRNLFANREKLQESGAIALTYPELVADPAGTIELVYRHFGWNIGPAFRRRLDVALARSRNYNSVNQYSLEEFGLDEKWIRRRLGDFLEAHDLTDAPKPQRARSASRSRARPPVGGRT